MTTLAPTPWLDREYTLRAICKAIIHRVRDENPFTTGHELLLRFAHANPFAAADEFVQDIWFEEVLSAVSRDEGNGDIVCRLLQERVTIH